MTFGESVSPTAAIKAILHDYPFSVGILRELLQNSNDADATEQLFVLDRRSHPAGNLIKSSLAKAQGPSLIAYNNAQFNERDWEAIQSIHQSSKRADTSKIGKYGVGFRACYHVTDGPQLLSGSSFAILDPLHEFSDAGGQRLPFEEFKKTDHYGCFDFVPGISGSNTFNGTVFRLPLRMAASELSHRVLHADELHGMIMNYIKEELNVSLLFLDNLKSIKIMEIDDAGKILHLAHWTKSEPNHLHKFTDQSPLIYNSVLSDESGLTYTWRVVQSQAPADDTLTRLQKVVGGDLVSKIMEKHKLRADVRIAYPISPPNGHRTSGRLFTFLPLPSKTDFPAQIHALFALTSSRQGLRNANETGIVPASDDDVLIKWNHLLFDEYIPRVWAHLLKSLVKDDGASDIFSAWPSLCSSISAGDGVYWEKLLASTFKVALLSGLAIWPKVSLGGGEPTEYVPLKSAFVTENNKVDIDVLKCLMKLGLTVVQLPKDFMDLIDETAVKMTPNTVYDPLKERIDMINRLSTEERKVLCGYILSTGDITRLFGLPLVPILSGSFVSLENRHNSGKRYTFLSDDECDVFKSLAQEAISLSQVDKTLARLIDKGSTDPANIDALGPEEVIKFLETTAQSSSEQWLIEFLTWLTRWRSGSSLIDLLKTRQDLRIVPTSNQNQSLASPIFKPVNDPQKTKVMEKFGLRFLSPVVPSLVVSFLERHSLLKRLENLDDILRVVQPDTLPPLTDEEASSIFRYFTAELPPALTENRETLRKLPIFPVLVPSCYAHESNSSVVWRSIFPLTIKGVSPMRLVPVIGGIHFLDKGSIHDPSCSMLKGLGIHLLSHADIILSALGNFSGQKGSVQAAFISYIANNVRDLPTKVTDTLKITSFILASDGSRQPPSKSIDPRSDIATLFPPNSSDSRLPRMDDAILGDLRRLRMLIASLTPDIVHERIQYIHASQHRETGKNLVSLMNNSSFLWSGVTINPSLRWLPTSEGLKSSEECIERGRSDIDFFDEVLTPLDESVINLSPSFRAVMKWDKPIALSIIQKQLIHVVGSASTQSQCRKIRSIIRELASRGLNDSDIESLKTIIGGRTWVPTKCGTLAATSRAVFIDVPQTSRFFSVAFSDSDVEIRQFLLNMGCRERPSTSSIVDELKLLQNSGAENDVDHITQVITLLELLPDDMTDEQHSKILIPTQDGQLVSLTSGIYYYPNSAQDSPDEPGVVIAHHLLTEAIAERLKLPRLGTDAIIDDGVDMGEKPVTTVRNALRQYEPEQFFTEFIANASDAKATRYELLIDEYEGHKTKLFSQSMEAFQGPSVVVFNDGVFTADDFKGIRQTGIGSKRDKSGTIGHFGLGALSMFHFTELAMIVSGDGVLFLNPSKENLCYRNRTSVLLPLKKVKQLYPDHLKPLNGLFGFDISSKEPYQGTLFRLPLRRSDQLKNEPIINTPWPVYSIKDMLIRQFNNLAVKSLLFTNLRTISISERLRASTGITNLCSVQSTRDPYSSDDGFESEKVTFDSTNSQLHSFQWLVASLPVAMPGEFLNQFSGKYQIKSLLPVRIAALCDGSRLSSEHNLFCTLPLPVTTLFPVHISAPFILEQERRNLRLNSNGSSSESNYNRWLLTDPIPHLYLYLLEKLLRIKGTNIAWWPKITADFSHSATEQMLSNAFWFSGILQASKRAIFASTYQGKYLNPSEATLFSIDSYPAVVEKVVSISKQVDVCWVPKKLFECAVGRARMKAVNPEFVKRVLTNSQFAVQLGKKEALNALWYISRGGVSLDGLPLLPLQDGSYATIQLKERASKVYYLQDMNMENLPFLTDHLVFRGYDGPPLEKKYNTSSLNEAGIVELTEECFNPTPENHGDWILKFWNVGIAFDPKKLSHLPLVPTSEPSKFISLDDVAKPWVVVTNKEANDDTGFNVGILRQLDMSIVMERQVPKALSNALPKNKPSIYHCFLESLSLCLKKRLDLISRLRPEEYEEIAQWVRKAFHTTPQHLVSTASKLPVWEVELSGRKELRALDEVTILPPQMPSRCFSPFTDQPVIDWEIWMQKLKKSSCSPETMVSYICLSRDRLLHQDQISQYKKLVKNLLKFRKIQDLSLLLPNEQSILKPATDLYERDKLFLESFKSQPHCLLLEKFQNIASSLHTYGLNTRTKLTVSVFLKCAKAFSKDKKPNKSSRSRTLYDAFRALSPSTLETSLCQELDDLKFIPRDTSTRPGYDLDLAKYLDELPPVLSPGEIVLSEYESIAWTQRGRPEGHCNPTMRHVYTGLGKPTAEEVVKHLKVLSQIGRNIGRNTALFSDLKATYKWMNDDPDSVREYIVNEHSERIFLNVNDPEKDEWEWHTTHELVIGLRDINEYRDVREFLLKYPDLLQAAGIHKMKKQRATPIPQEGYSKYHKAQQLKYHRMRQEQCLTDVAFILEEGGKVLVAHRVVLASASDHFADQFTQGFVESTTNIPQASDDGQDVTIPAGHVPIQFEGFSSQCVNAVFDWIYLGQLPSSFTRTEDDDGNAKERYRKISALLDFALDMLHLSHYWNLELLHQQLQVYITDADDLINPYTCQYSKHNVLVSFEDDSLMNQRQF
ncbi:hypothetical protein AMATHDRAFT_6333 [Amanita thiersii Skay4041]|uniref:BTB domain-containing protein n=1 Tax=Amanita thiersii Skay4041 TaxID=703135 RepID=A0A2A9NJC4_9AGAR|nr:hypothetical protein AMATHDRAFT_6333 [Amanita thiersii Skay4041]